MTLAYASRQPCDEALARGFRRPFPCPQRDKPWVLVTAILGSSLVFVESSVANLALPAIQSDFAATSAGVQWVMNAYLLMLVSFMLIGGSLGDRYGLRRVFMLGTGVFAFGALGCAFAPGLPLLIVARLVQGFGGALLVPTSLGLIASHFDEAERGRAIGTWAGASALTTALGPVLGGWLVDRWGWPSVFLLIPVLAALTLGIAWWRVPVSPIKDEDRLDYLGALLLAAALGLVVYALVNAGPTFRQALLFIFGCACGAAFIWRERGFATPMLPLDLFRSRSFSGANLMTQLLYFALIGALYFLPFNLIQVQGYTAAQAGAAFLPFTLILGFGSTFAGDLIRKASPRIVLTLGPMLTALGFVALAIPGARASYITGFLPGIVLIGVGMTLSVAPLTTVVLGSVPERRAGIASGVNNTAARLGGVIAVAALTGVAVWRFADALASELHAANVPTALIEELLDGAARLAELGAPPNTPQPLAAAIADAVAVAYVETFRLLTIICGVLAAVSGLVAWFSLAPAHATPRNDAQPV
jgi:EmrB/QacA subfamily drug resistance transporter